MVGKSVGALAVWVEGEQLITIKIMRHPAMRILLISFSPLLPITLFL
jgi:hypothetical protein